MKITIDGKICEAQPGEFILEVARRNNIYIYLLYVTMMHFQVLPAADSA